MIEKIIITSLFVLGYCCTFWEGQIFENIGNWLDTKLPDWISKPLYGCFICAVMWWGTALYWAIWGESVKEWFVVVVSAMGLNAALSKMFVKDEETITRHYLDEHDNKISKVVKKVDLEREAQDMYL